MCSGTWVLYFFEICSFSVWNFHRWLRFFFEIIMYVKPRAMFSSTRSEDINPWNQIPANIFSSQFVIYRTDEAVVFYLQRAGQILVSRQKIFFLYWYGICIILFGKRFTSFWTLKRISLSDIKCNIYCPISVGIRAIMM